MVRHLVSYAAAFLLCSALSGPALSQQPTCRPPDAGMKRFPPVVLYTSVVACATQSHYDIAMRYFALAGAFVRFDMQRPDYESGEGAEGIVMKMALDRIPQPNRDEFKQFARAAYDDHDTLEAVCRLTEPLGPPTYDPAQMLADALKAFPGIPQKAPAPASTAFDPNEAWHKALALYLNCGSTEIILKLTVNRAVQPESDLSVAPHSIDATPDGGYIIVAGMDSMDRRTNEVIKTDAQGNEQWRYALSNQSQWHDQMADVYSPKVSSALALRSGHWLLCGDVYESAGRGTVPRSTLPPSHTVALLTELDAQGRFQSKRELVPDPDAGYRLLNVYACTKSTDGLVLIGLAAKQEKGTAPQYAFWLAAVGEDGAVKREQLAPTAGFAWEFSRPRVVADGSVIFGVRRSSSQASTELLHIDSGGRLLRKSVMSGAYLVVQGRNPSKPLRLVAALPGDETKSLLTLDQNFEIRAQEPGSLPHDGASLASEQEDGSMVIFGRSEGRASIVKWGPKHDAARYIFPGGVTSEVGDAVLAASANEFAALEIRRGNGDKESDSGLRLVFAQAR